jgi:hypothetical protein
MGRATAWYDGNDMRVRLDTLKTSTMGSTSYLNSSTGVTVAIWSETSTDSTANLVVASRNMPYVSASNGRYDVVIQSTDHTMALRTNGMAVIVVEDSALDAEWRPTFLVQQRRTT